MSAATAYVMCPKEDTEILTIKKACLVSVDVFTKYLKDQIMEIIDADKVNIKLKIKIKTFIFVAFYIFIYVLNYFFRKSNTQNSPRELTMRFLTRNM